MAERTLHLHDGKKGAALAVRVTPRASRNEISEVLSDGTVKIHLTAPPVDGKANEALLKFVAASFGVPLRQVELKQGGQSRHKVVAVTGSHIEPESLLPAG